DYNPKNPKKSIPFNPKKIPFNPNSKGFNVDETAFEAQTVLKPLQYLFS
ncbi:MAG: hypothetical protein RLZZ628_4036, partial [Bacteroidota bacterium]